jgi:hypothetical protein
MSEVRTDECIHAASPFENGNSSNLGPADWLCLAAAPSFAIMAMIAGAGDGPDVCSAMHGASSLSGMVPMYVLMSAFHSTPWLTLIAKRRGARHG